MDEISRLADANTNRSCITAIGSRKSHNCHGFGNGAVEETVDYLLKKGEKVGVLKVHLYRPFSAKHFFDVL